MEKWVMSVWRDGTGHFSLLRRSGDTSLLPDGYAEFIFSVEGEFDLPGAKAGIAKLREAAKAEGQKRGIKHVTNLY